MPRKVVITFKVKPFEIDLKEKSPPSSLKKFISKSKKKKK